MEPLPPTSRTPARMREYALVIENFHVEDDLNEFILEEHRRTSLRSEFYDHLISALGEFFFSLLDGATDVSRVIDVQGKPVLFTAVHSPTEDHVAVSARLA